MTVDGHTWTLRSPRESFVRESRTWGEPPAGHALIEVLGCGVCHTDLGFADGDVAPKAKLPLVLGHEIVGRVLAVGPSAERDSSWVGRRVLVPAVTPCGQCPACHRGRATACARGYMPGNDGDGGFATHAFVPARSLFPLDDRATTGDAPIGAAKLSLWEIAPVADAATTAYQSLVRAGLARDDVAVIVGAGGVGGFATQFAHAMGARTVVLDVSSARLKALATSADVGIDTQGMEPRAIRDAVRTAIRGAGWGERTVRVFEASGTAAGQTVAFDLVERGGTLSIVGFTPAKVNLRLSNVMALDAEVFGNWGCDPALFPQVLAHVLEGRVEVRPFVAKRALSDINAVFAELRAHTLSHRVVLIP